MMPPLNPLIVAKLRVLLYAATLLTLLAAAGFFLSGCATLGLTYFPDERRVELFVERK